MFKKSKTKNVLLKIGVLIPSLLTALIPIGFYLCLCYLLLPATFWKILAMIAIGLFLGSVQILFLAILVIWTIFIWADV